MDKDQFHNRLKDVGINKQEFADLTGVAYSTITNWGVMREGKPMVIPNWVEPFLNYYEKAQKLELVMSDVCSKLQEAKKL